MFLAIAFNETVLLLDYSSYRLYPMHLTTNINTKYSAMAKDNFNSVFLWKSGRNNQSYRFPFFNPDKSLVSQCYKNIDIIDSNYPHLTVNIHTGAVTQSTA